MKIVFLAPFGVRPKGTVLARMIPLAVELQRRGHTVPIVAPPYTNPEDSGKAETIQGVTITNITLTGSCSPVARRTSHVARNAAAAAVLPWRMLKTAMAEKPDLIHLFKPKGYGGIAAFLQILFRRLGLRLPPVFIDSDDWEGRGGMNDLLPYSAAERTVFRLQEQWLPRNSEGVTVASVELQSLFRGMGIPDDKILYLPNCVADERSGADGTAVRACLGIDASAPVLLLYTRFFEFSQEKLHRLLADVHRRVPAVRFLIVGAGKNHEEELLIAAGKEKGFPDALAMAGWVQPEALPGFLAAGDVALYPFDDNLINRCKCPAKLTELLLAERPVVAHAVGQIAEYIEHGVSGELCRAEDWEGMAESAVRLLLDRERAVSLGKVGRRRMLEKFAWKDAAERLEEFYLRRIIDNPISR